MNILIVDCFDTWEHRVDLLHQILTAEGHRVQCLLSDYRHFEKVYRTEPKKDFRFFHAQAYQKNISPDRLLSHIRQVRDTIEHGEGVGRKLDFLAQEMNREANTILSKAGDMLTSDLGVALKTDIEKIREQIQNIE